MSLYFSELILSLKVDNVARINRIIEGDRVFFGREFSHQNSITKLAKTIPLSHQAILSTPNQHLAFEFVSTGSSGEDIAVRKNCTYFYFTNLSLAQKTRFKLFSSVWLVLSLIYPLLISICAINASTESNGED